MSSSNKTPLTRQKTPNLNTLALWGIVHTQKIVKVSFSAIHTFNDLYWQVLDKHMAEIASDADIVYLPHCKFPSWFLDRIQ
jgi:hypothetical protein